MTKNRKIMLFFLGLFITLVAVAFVLATLSNDVPLGEKVALVKVEGVILSSKETVKELKKYREDSSIKAIVVRVNSPGGAVVPSQEIYSEIKKTTGKKKIVVVSMGSLAASGGYYISAPATKIIANQGTITGSIGVIMETLNISGLMSKVGVNSEVVKSGKFKDIASMYRGIGKEERAILQGVLDDTHSQFIEAVSEGRHMPIEKVREIADGRIFTGRQALALGLVDKLGTLQDAIYEAARMAGIKGEPHVVSKKEDFSLTDLLSSKLNLNLLPGLKINYLMSF
ncbi:MAG: signal peptide peptidase SppA [Nitrospirae bacterium]|nr:signal peptide peptidase SppA [Nitrospirota bacterium]MBF0535896.1 signal peptide peptidase SppA [Nitrospirota bacterium]MBF0617771.1 signal peptide peptidase SppA [Nitrospirota bacterium]